MIQKTIDKYLNVTVQKIEFDIDGKIIASNDLLFKASNASTIFEIHPFLKFVIQLFKIKTLKKFSK